MGREPTQLSDFARALADVLPNTRGPGLEYLDCHWPNEHPLYHAHYAALRSNPNNWHKLQRERAYAGLHLVRAQIRDCESERLRPRLMDRAAALVAHIDRLDDIAELAGLSTAALPPSGAEPIQQPVDEMLGPIRETFEQAGHRVTDHGEVDASAAAWFLGVSRDTLRKWRSEKRGPACVDRRYSIGALLDFAFKLASQPPTPGRRTSQFEHILSRIPALPDPTPQFIDGADGCGITAPARSSDDA
jgi:hypothetical protein